MAFTREAVEAVGESWNIVRPININLFNIENKKISFVDRDKNGENYVVIWQIQVFTQCIIRRTVSLANSCMSMWNNRNAIGSALFARALIETVAFVYDLEIQVSKAVKEGNLKLAKDLIENRTLSTRSKRLIASNPSAKSTNILTIIQKIDKEYDGILEAYEDLSEVCHPNVSGTLFMYANMNEKNCNVTFSYEKGYNKTLFDKIFSACILLAVMEESLSGLDRCVAILSEQIKI